MKKYVLKLSESNLVFTKDLLQGKTFSLTYRYNDLNYADGHVDPWQDSANNLISTVLSFARGLRANGCFYFLHGQYDREEREYFAHDWALPTVPTEVFYDGYYNVIVIKTREHSIKAMFSKYFILF